MAEVVTKPVQPETPAPVPGPGSAPKKDGTNKKKTVKNLIALAVAVGVLAAGGFGLHSFLNSNDGPGEIFSQPAMRGSIQSKVSGMGTANPSNQQAIALKTSGTIQVQEVFVNVGDMVTEGQPLYTIYSPKVEENVQKAQGKLNEELAKQDKLNVRPPFAGKLVEVKEFRVGDQIAQGTEIAKLVNDKTLKLSLYFSYAYENEISVGQKVKVSIPAVMGNFEGRVEKLHKVSFISPEGAEHFEVVITFPNPGTLTAGMDVSAVLTAADGTEIYPYENGKTEYYEERSITAEAPGSVVKVGNLHNFANVGTGEVLLALDADTLTTSIDEARLALEEALAEQEKCAGIAPISGTVMSCNLVAGEELEVKTGEALTVITISDNAKMQVQINVDDRNISFIKPNSTVELDWNGNMYMGTVTKIDMGGAQQGQGMTNFPVTLTVDNYDGSLMGGAWLKYSFVTSEALDVITVPASSVQYFSDTEGNRQSVVFVRRDSRPEDVPELELPTFEPGQDRSFPDEKEGFYPVIVETGLADIQNVEIVSGVEEGDEIFIAYTVKDSAGSW